MYRLIRFGSTSLSHYNQVESVGSGRLAGSYLALATGGAYDLFGSAPVLPHTTEIRKTVRLVGSSESDLLSQYFALLALKGKRDQLWRRVSTGEYQWITARLEEISGERSYQVTPYKVFQDVSLIWVANEAGWHGANHDAGWTLDSGEFLDMGLVLDSESKFFLSSSPAAVMNGGNYPVTDVILSIHPVDATITALDLQLSGENGESYHLEYAGSIGATEYLKIDCAGFMVVLYGMAVVDEYDHLSLGAGHASEAWLKLKAGANNITISMTGGSANSYMIVTFRDRWA